MSSFSFSILLLPLALCLSFQAHLIVAQWSSQSSSHLSSSLINTACQDALDKHFCVNLLTSDTRSLKANMKGLAFTAFRFAEKNATATELFIKKTLNDREQDLQPEVDQALSDCSDHYLTAVELIEDSINALVSDAPNDVVKFMDAAVADLDACDESVKDGIGAAAEVASKNRALRQLITTALSIARVAQPAH